MPIWWVGLLRVWIIPGRVTFRALFGCQFLTFSIPASCSSSISLCSSFLASSGRCWLTISLGVDQDSTFIDLFFRSLFSGKSVGVIGLGRIGSAIAKRARAFGCAISYHSRTRKPCTGYKFYEGVAELASNSDVLFVSCSLTEETRHIVNRQVIDALGPRGVLVNIGRGAHVDEAELVSALAEGRLGGAGLDVFESEPDVPKELLEMGNAVVQSHVGSDTDETCKAMADLVLNNLEAHFRKSPLLTPVL